MSFLFEDYDSNEIKWLWKNESQGFTDSGKGKWYFKNQTCWTNIPKDKSAKSVLTYNICIKRNNINSVLMFVLMPTLIITLFNIVCYLLPIGGTKNNF